LGSAENHVTHQLTSPASAYRTTMHNTAHLITSPRLRLRLAPPRRSCGDPLGGATEPGRDPAAERDRELLPYRHGDARVEYAEASRLDLLEQRQVDPPHDLGGHEGAGVGRREAFPREPVEVPRARRPIGHPPHERPRVAAR